MERQFGQPFPRACVACGQPAEHFHSINGPSARCELAFCELHWKSFEPDEHTHADWDYFMHWLTQA